MDRKQQLAEIVKAKRKTLNLSQSTLAYESGVSIATIVKLEKGESIKDENLGKILCKIGLLDTLSLFRKEQNIVGYKALSLEELRTCVACCKDIIRDGNQDEKRDAVFYKNLADSEIKLRLKNLFKEQK